MFSLATKIAVVTGSGSGIGRAIALVLARQGATVHLLERNAEAAAAVVAEIEAAGGQAWAHGCDVSQQADVLAAFQQIGHLDMLVNNAGIAQIGNVEQTSAADFEAIFRVNVQGIYNCLFAALPLLRAGGGGTIVNMSSIAALVGLADRFGYSMSKGAVAAMTRSVARDYLGANIRCNSISPARVHTPFVDGYLARSYPDNTPEMFAKLAQSQPIGRMGTPDEVAALALFLCSDEASFITGMDYPLDGGVITLST